jgi:hypothetical protein
MSVREERPDPAECNSYYHTYTRLVPDGDIVATLRDQQGGLRAGLAGMDETKAEVSPAPGEWSTKQVLCHLIDTERLFVFRAMWFARGETTDLPGMQPDPWVALAGAQARPLADLLAEFDHLRAASIAFYASLDDTAWMRAGKASGFPITVRALAWISAGHERHHLISLREKHL